MIPVTILTVTFNAEKTISRTIESVMGQTYPEIEYIVLDGASSDKTVATAELYLDRFNAQEGRNMVIISEPDNGIFDAMNKGARLGHGTLVGQINADDCYEPGAVETMVKLYEREKYNVGWGSVRLLTGKGALIKHAKLPNRVGIKIWTTSHWHHSTQFAERETLLQHPYVCENLADDFEFLTWCYVNGKKFAVTDDVITNFAFGGVSTQKSFRGAMARLEMVYGIYRKYGFSRLYWFQRFAYEMAKYFMA